jgi:hypothetical protein
MKLNLTQARKNQARPTFSELQWKFLDFVLTVKGKTQSIRMWSVIGHAIRRQHFDRENLKKKILAIIALDEKGKWNGLLKVWSKLQKNKKTVSMVTGWDRDFYSGSKLHSMCQNSLHICSGFKCCKIKMSHAAAIVTILLLHVHLNMLWNKTPLGPIMTECR